MYVGQLRPTLTVILISIVTCGIYGIVWHYWAMTDLNKVRGTEVINPVLFVILMLFVPFINLYVIYTYEMNMKQICAEEKIEYPEDNMVILLIVCLLLPGIDIYRYQNKYNELWLKRGANPNSAGSAF